MSSVRALKAANITNYSIVTNEQLAETFQRAGHSVIVEPQAHGGPLRALYHGFHALKNEPGEWFQVLAGDLPMIHGELLLTLQNTAIEDVEADIVLPIHKGRAQPLHALYHRRTLHTLETIIEHADHMGALYDASSTKYLAFADEEKGFLNINSEHDWQGSF
ncbi:molybdopterin-guanine dinucleotide biosynthesis protein MobA [Geomicrobium sp. JCM 19037]|uniref:molybdenum cofactor guanylyltransferase n=2 Tax=unclassified Geomicrobium TaxID=2628951 RepID=UPI00045F1AD9|nr:NTP transferase domain-containing protein [Geomicrobium sp. JCM 19037]GAK05323.1 molybdopterin-guanine dinucleotide biosynthesis protein MobA [Geomicrobium sp. JCM 19037]